MIGYFVLTMALSITNFNSVERGYFVTEKECQTRAAELGAKHYLETGKVVLFQCNFKGVK